MNGTALVSKPARYGARTLSSVDSLPVAVRAVLRYYAETGSFDPGVLKLKSRVEETRERLVDDAFAAIEDAIATEFDVVDPEFDYSTKLLLPVDLTLAQVYGSVLERTSGDEDPLKAADSYEWDSFTVSPTDVERVDGVGTSFSELTETVRRTNAMSELVVEALLDGDMRDALNDGEFEDFEVSFAAGDEERRAVASLAQRVLKERIQPKFDSFPNRVREAYDRAVDYSERHQDRDQRFRSYVTEAREGDPDAEERIEATYKHAEFVDVPELFSAEDLSLPYLKTQYGRVGVIYDGMVEMYRGAGVPIDDEFKRSVVLAIIGAQLWLDDIDDFDDDLADDQLTPVTAEYLLAETDREGYRRVIDITEQYFEAARRYAASSDSPLTGIAIEYILLSGDPTVLPGSTGERPG